MYENISLEAMIEYANCIVIAKKAKPVLSSKDINITPFWRRLSGKEYPPFRKIIYHFYIMEVLYTEANISKGKKVKIYPANQKNDFRMHKEYLLKDIGESPIYESYKYNINDATFSGNIFNNSEELILFFKTTNNRDFTFVVEGAWESVAIKSKVNDLIKKKNQLKELRKRFSR